MKYKYLEYFFPLEVQNKAGQDKKKLPYSGSFYFNDYF
jgi:hypothetical protein